MSDDNCQSQADVIKGMAQDLGCPLTPDMKILDFGCGDGKLATTFIDMGYNALGADIKKFWSDKAPCENKLHVISLEPYRIPFGDNSFDFIFSNSVFEHVLNHEESFREIHRVLKHGGSTLHFFPGPWYLPAEPHICVPFASIIHSKWWLSIWAILGIRNEFQKNMGWRQVVNSNMEFCKTGINYISRKKVKKLAEKIFGNVKFAKNEFIKHSTGGAAKLGRMMPIPGYSSLVFSFRNGAVFMKKDGGS